jgi:hypothetical protein
MDIFSILKQEHEVIATIFKKIMDTTERAEKTRAQLYEQLYRELHSHALAEEKALYTRLAQEETMKHLLAEAEEEHAQIERMLKELGKMDDTTIEWTAKATVLQENVEHHVKEEEHDMFKQTKAVLKDGEAEQLGEAFVEYKKELLAKMS